MSYFFTPIAPPSPTVYVDVRGLQRPLSDVVMPDRTRYTGEQAVHMERALKPLHVFGAIAIAVPVAVKAAQAIAGLFAKPARGKRRHR